MPPRRTPRSRCCGALRRSKRPRSEGDVAVVDLGVAAAAFLLRAATRATAATAATAAAPAFAAFVGASVSELPVNHRPRVAGRSKYGIGRSFKVLFDLLVVKFLSGYSTKPIYVFGTAATASGVLGVLALLVAGYQRLIGISFVHRNPLFYLGIFLGGLAMQFLLMGLIAEVGIRTYHESQGKPIYVVREVLRSGDGAAVTAPPA